MTYDWMSFEGPPILLSHSVGIDVPQFRSYTRNSMAATEKYRARLESTAFADLGAMMEGYALAAQKRANAEYKQKLDFSAASIDGLDEIVVRVGESPELDLDFEVRLWGSYLGEVVRRRYAGLWEMTQYPGGVAAVPAVEVRGSRLFPLTKVFRRLTEGSEEDLVSFYAMVTERLGSPAQVN